VYNVSNAFHQAVAQGKPQMAMLIFPDAVFTNPDINVDNGIEFGDYFNTNEDVSIGMAPSNELRFSLFNDARLLNNYEFGDFLATVGVLISTETYTTNANCRCTTSVATYTGHNTTPYLRRGGVGVSSPASFPVKSILGYDGKVWAFSADGTQFKVYRDSDGADITSGETVNAFMQDKAMKWAGGGYNYNKSTRILDIWKNRKHETYEFCPFGYFTADRPNVPDVIQIDFSCNDYMIKFDKDMPTAEDLGVTYPITIGELFVKMCEYVDVQYATSTFINSTATITKEPDEFMNTTMRQVMQWIAEAAASILRFNRDGILVFDWIRSTNLSLNEGDYSDFGPYWYETKQIDALYNRTTSDGSDLIVGTGDNAYLIQDNPLLKGVN